MAGNKAISFEIVEGYDRIIEEKGNTCLALKKIAWNGAQPRLDLRKWFIDSEGNDVMGKGVSLSDEAANTLTETLVEDGYGDTNKIMECLRTREDFTRAVAKVVSSETVARTEELLAEENVIKQEAATEEVVDFYDPSAIFE
jgi:hypothetical protein